jgi:hypothetical protein
LVFCLGIRTPFSDFFLVLVTPGLRTAGTLVEAFEEFLFPDAVNAAAPPA